jgi:ribonucleoside-diphosphate reductase alpha chain
MEHLDIEEFLDIRKNSGDISRKCLSNNFHHAVNITDEFMQSLKDGNKENRRKWGILMKNRAEFGEPYITFIDTANKKAPQMYKDRGLKIETSNLCNEIYLHTDPSHTFVCCLSSMNLSSYEEWKNTDAVYLATYFLDGVMQEFIDKARHIDGFEKAVRFAEKSRALGLGALGWHTLLQSKMTPFDSFAAMQLNAEVFKKINNEATRATKDMAAEFGEPEWCKGYGIRNSHLMAVAPNTTSAILAGGVSQSIEPFSANIFNQKTAKGVLIRKNAILEKILEERGFNNVEIWNQINQDRGSVKNISCLSVEEKEVFLTAREINQFAIVRQAGQRQRYIDQGQSVNLLFAMPSDLSDAIEKQKLAKYINDVHMEAWELGLKGLYYLRTEAVLKGEAVFKESSDCKSCEG